MERCVFGRRANADVNIFAGPIVRATLSQPWTGGSCSPGPAMPDIERDSEAPKEVPAETPNEKAVWA
jgi:hypothetical protein